MMIVAALLVPMLACAKAPVLTDATPVPVSIPTMGADPSAPWSVHLDEGLAVHSLPLGDAPVLGTLPVGTLVSGDYYRVEETDEEWLAIEHEGVRGWISRVGVNRVHPANAAAIAQHGDLPYGTEVVNRWWGIPHEYEPSDLVTLPDAYVSRPDSDREYQLRREAAEAMMRMLDAAEAEGFGLRVASPYRSGATQRRIYAGNVARNPAQRSSAPPGHSEHQLGTTADLVPWPREEGARGFLKKDDAQHGWLLENAERFGFRQTYRAGNIAETGYIEEPWHWRYMGTE